MIPKREPVRLCNGRLTRQAPARSPCSPSPALERLTDNWPGGKSFGIFAGYAYFAQFLAHELVRRDARKSDPPFLRSSLFDLESVYGTDLEQCFQQLCDPATGRFLLAWTEDDEGNGSSLRDLPRRDKRALIPEPRNDENLITSQLHCLILRFHNWTVDQLQQTPGCRHAPRQLFHSARLHVITTLHRITVTDFLQKLSDENVFERIFVAGRQYIHFDADESLPLEFTAAAFRFGHSMIRANYDINSRRADASLRNLTMQQVFLLCGKHGLVDMDQPERQFAQLPESKMIDWLLFFGKPYHVHHVPGGDGAHPGKWHRNSDFQPNSSFLLNPAVTLAMRELTGEHGPDADIMVRNINHGIERRLKSGPEVAGEILERLGMTAGNNELNIGDVLPLANNNELSLKQELLAGAGLLHDTPLWLYLLIEAAEVNLGTRLGPLGSLLVCETIRNAIRNQQNVFTDEEQKEIKNVSSRIPQTFLTMLDLINHIQGDFHDHSNKRQG